MIIIENLATIIAWSMLGLAVCVGLIITLMIWTLTR